tara:strand:- start:44 stop:679 length:636 start_codon:yes stop_codon:yes gene_type:complete
MEKKEINWTKWFALGLGGLLGVSHIGMIGIIANRGQKVSKFPQVNVPVGDYSTYEIEAGTEGYRLRYRANDPKVMIKQKDIKRKGGFLGFSNNTTFITEEYTMDGATHHGGPVSTRSAWIDPAALAVTGGDSEGKLTAKTEECIKAVGGAETTGRLVGSSVGAAAAPAVSGIPFVGWLAAGWVTMFGGDQGADIGGGMAQGLNDACLDAEE